MAMLASRVQNTNTLHTPSLARQRLPSTTVTTTAAPALATATASATASASSTAPATEAADVGIGIDAYSTTECNCWHSVHQSLGDIRGQFSIDFDTVIDTGSHFSRQLEKLLACPLCRTDVASLVTLSPVLEQVLFMYEAACMTYAFLQPDFPADGHKDGKVYSVPPLLTTPFPAAAMVCRPVRINWGALELQDHDARLLVKMLLRRRLGTLAGLLEGIHEMLLDLWEIAWPQQRGLLEECERSLSASAEKLDGLMGGLSGDAI
ncbi:hypothetical protein Plec18170_003224 [Paecilomyces lecythidis]